MYLFESEPGGEVMFIFFFQAKKFILFVFLVRENVYGLCFALIISIKGVWLKVLENWIEIEGRSNLLDWAKAKRTTFISATNQVHLFVYVSLE